MHGALLTDQFIWWRPAVVSGVRPFRFYQKYYLNDSAGICLHRSELLRFYHLSYQEKQVIRQKPNSLDQYTIDPITLATLSFLFAMFSTLP